MVLILSTLIPSSKFIEAIYRSLYLGALVSGEEKVISSLQDNKNLAFASGWEQQVPAKQKALQKGNE